MSKKQEKALEAFNKRVVAFAKNIHVCDEAWLYALSDTVDDIVQRTSDAGIHRVLRKLADAARDVEAYLGVAELDRQKYGE